MNITKLCLLTNGLQEQREFYTRILGLPLLNETETTVTMQVGKTELVFLQSDAGIYPFYHFAFNITSTKFALAKAWLAERCPLLEMNGIDQVTHQSWNAQSCYFYDPAGNVVEFIARYNLSTDRGGAFTEEDVLNISEIGLVVDDVVATIDFIGRSIGEKVWKEQSNTFTAMGDDHGLLVLAQVGRIWLLTEKPAEVHPVTIIIQGATSQHVRIADFPYQISVAPEK